MRNYEELFIVKPESAEEEIDQLVEQLRQAIAAAGGDVEKIEKWGLRKLAYQVRKHREGFYVLLQFSASPHAVREVERRLRVAEPVLKFLTVRIDEKMKKIEKRKARREKRAARKPAPPAAPAQPAAEELMAAGEPGTERG